VPTCNVGLTLEHGSGQSSDHGCFYITHISMLSNMVNACIYSAGYHLVTVYLQMLVIRKRQRTFL